ncbi:alpha-hydroxy acid oxidase [Deinococcus radiodurans]|jgi:L-lactate dehydrogenase (FMN-dependent) and related alpha-hydroxy acid dehydrogenases|uniref:(S)-2-hydroxy-acid oxidase n=1 Tax=Deinococcus radiodurans (strain ATCC 13939 / DSM 20539 / JCM 16871 / CCUG 27074 / LMG 4051 / NBRC 15346 / NCIMB 9279 / VKM B-1422 / R1) TaxID=243230 RepID=Q9RVJ7_DEIRA|nr:alpha-hydroxy acid oxidase [Deinococcus radiodurans]AAF10604.1 (S)-2-hydroxy-acid oxidase [Deinococcus radiodurans R1 = ATCC 13939 = DSM 20539]ANC71785.1 alpha-hydroxy-acid oxidizing enzyme [Deinococcus radiodurans R1 = ATCC 13939 = DSM 20539]QEM70521.1 alpha-hydroxy-acid oxidizing protein [Deinococcus radiodurans]QIP29127.1 alpha-hydroxy-acid oxidizing protein [Deinococcus radiodurans]QIP32175.1 alpha-hydroxy-acid oxidizing protein [Deinococcus radiodurans]
MSLPYLNLREMEQAAAGVLPPAAFAYYTGGANDEHTLRENREGYARLKLRPRMLVDVSHIDTSTTVLGLPLAFPVGVAPCALHGLVHPDAEVATARAAASLGSLMTLSTMSHRTIEDVSDAAGGQFWFQLYLYKDREVSRALVQRAEAAGARALVLTVDAPVLGRREAIIRTPVHIEPGTVLPNIGPRVPGSEHLDDLQYFDSLLDPAITWNDIGWLRGITGLPIVLKGLLTAEDVALAVQHGCHIWASNHGGRQLDTAVTALDALPEIAEAANGRAEIYLDGGVTRGTDVLKALALGANAVFLARAVLYGLALAGEDGARHTLELLRDEVRLAMMLCGKTQVSELGPELIWR